MYVPSPFPSPTSMMQQQTSQGGTSSKDFVSFMEGLQDSRNIVVDPSRAVSMATYTETSSFRGEGSAEGWGLTEECGLAEEFNRGAGLNRGVWLNNRAELVTIAILYTHIHYSTCC